MATSIGIHESKFQRWNTGQLVILLSRSRTTKDIIFVRKEESSFTTLVSVLTKRTQWFKLHEQSINTTTINDNETNN